MEKHKDFLFVTKGFIEELLEKSYGIQSEHFAENSSLFSDENGNKIKELENNLEGIKRDCIISGENSDVYDMIYSTVIEEYENIRSRNVTPYQNERITVYHCKITSSVSEANSTTMFPQTKCIVMCLFFIIFFVLFFILISEEYIIPRIAMSVHYYQPPPF
ncbi:unnamed protein product [Dracunculus medinensis]|uniref:PIR Superfamily Protein n=1 Tax=Dracunculus medinensis TaxID=318479 RepID=A0A0N4UQA3_DRAME|nr:unnamed protein product [Dracunculus medinensis]